jgi:hypothetical protein
MLTNKKLHAKNYCRTFSTERLVDEKMAPKTPEQNEEIRKKTRQRIIDAAFKKFAQEGYSRTSVSAVAKKSRNLERADLSLL